MAEEKRLSKKIKALLAFSILAAWIVVTGLCQIGIDINSYNITFWAKIIFWAITGTLGGATFYITILFFKEEKNGRL